MDAVVKPLIDSMLVGHETVTNEALLLAEAQAEIVRLRAEVVSLKARLATRSRRKAELRASGYNEDGSMHCPFGDIPGVKPCTDHHPSGCGGEIPE